MSNEFEPRHGTANPARCKAAVHSCGVPHARQCRRSPWRDGWCQQHHPDTEKARHDASLAKYREEIATTRRLTIAAPGLLAACKALLHHFCGSGERTQSDSEVMAQAQDAIAAAEPTPSVEAAEPA